MSVLKKGEQMKKDTLFTMTLNAIMKPEVVWKKELSNEISWQDYLKYPILPIIATVAIISGILTKLFGFHIPAIGAIYPSMTDTLLQITGFVIVFVISLIILGFIAAYIAGVLGGKNDINQAIKMLFLISIPSLIGQVFGALPFVGWIISLGLGIYSLVLLYRAIPEFLGVSIENRVKHFIFFIIAAIVVSMLINMTIGRIFAPKDMIAHINKDILTNSQNGSHKIDLPGEKETKSENPVQDYIESMSKGDYNQKTITDSANDTFTPPENGRLTKEQVQKFITYAKKVKIVEKEQAQRLKEKYEKKEKSDDFSISDIFNGLKDVSNLATLEMKVVKSNGGNWAEYQWIKDRVREAYYTPSLNETTKYNAKLIEGEEETIKSIL